jgi:SAM-dependent methyltransferase
VRGPSRAQARGVLETARAGHVAARALAIADSRALVRSLWLASAVRAGLIEGLAAAGPAGRSFAEIAAQTGCLRFERLRAWLDVGTELGELTRRGGRYRLRGRRARAIAGGDALLGAHYRSMLDYQAGPYADLAALLRSRPGEGRADLDRHAAGIAQVSTAATPFIASYLTRVIGASRPARILDVGCGTAVYCRIAAEASPAVSVDGIDLAEAVLEEARAELRDAGLGGRVTLHAGDVRRWSPPPGTRYDLVLLLNNVYYFPPGERVALYRRLGSLLRAHGQLVVASQTTPGSVAAAHLDFMLSCQAGAAALPRPGELQADLRSAGFEVRDVQPIVPAEPFVAITAGRR